VRVLDELEREIERIAAEAGEAKTRRRWWRPGVALVALPLVAGAVAVAATSGNLLGEPVKDPPGAHSNPKSGYGVVVGSGKMLAARATDPDGGPEWGLRLVQTSRKFGCVQLGRVVDGKLGVLGRDSSFGDDGMFHELRPQTLQLPACQQPDKAGHVFIAMNWVGLPDSADATACSARSSKLDKRPLCPPDSLRTVYLGLLGPEGKAVTYVAPNGRVVRQRVTAPEGAYLVVLRTKNPEHRNIGYFGQGVTPASGLRSVEYRDGSVCRITDPRRIGGARACPLKGFVAPKLPAVTAAELATTIRVHVGKRPVHPGPKVKPPKGFPPTPAQRRVTIVFRARRSANARSYYTVTARMLKGGKGCQYITVGPIAKDVAAGTVVSYTLSFPYRCHATLQVDVGYVQQRRPSKGPFLAEAFGKANVGQAFAKLG
jgi:hypothetical protein